MGVVLRQSAKFAASNFLGIGLGAFNILWLFPRYLSTIEIGILTTLESAAILGSTLAGLGINVITDRFFPLHKQVATKHAGYFGFLLLYVFVAWVVFGGVLWVVYDMLLQFYAQKSPEVSPYFIYVFPFAGLLALQYALESFARVHLRIAIPNLLREFVLRILITTSVVLYAMQWLSFSQIVWIRVASYGVICLFLLIYLLKLNIPFWYIDKKFFQKANIYPILKFGFFTFWGALGVALVMKLDVLMLGSLLNQSEVGIFAITFFIGNVLEIPRKSIAQISQPLLAQAWRSNDLPLIQKMYAQSSCNSLIVGSWMFLGIWLNIDSLFMYIPNGEIYQRGKYVVLYIAITRLIDMAMGLNSEIITQSKYYLFNFASVLALIGLVVLFNLLFIPVYGITGVAVSSLIAITVSNIAKFSFLYIKFGLQPLTKVHIWVLCILFICLQIAWIPVFLPIWADILLRSVLITVLYWSMNLYLNTSLEISSLLRKIGW